MVGGQSVSERRIIPVGDLEREDTGASAVGAFEPVGVVGVVDQAGEREDLATGTGRPARYMAGMARSLSIVGLAGSAAGSGNR